MSYELVSSSRSPVLSIGSRTDRPVSPPLPLTTSLPPPRYPPTPPPGKQQSAQYTSPPPSPPPSSSSLPSSLLPPPHLPPPPPPPTGPAATASCFRSEVEEYFIGEDFIPVPSYNSPTPVKPTAVKPTPVEEDFIPVPSYHSPTPVKPTPATPFTDRKPSATKTPMLTPTFTPMAHIRLTGFGDSGGEGEEKESLDTPDQRRIAERLSGGGVGGAFFKTVKTARRRGPTSPLPLPSPPSTPGYASSKVASRHPPGHWPCLACTVVNAEEHAWVCGCCGTARAEPAKEPEEEKRGGGAGSGGAGSGGKRVQRVQHGRDNWGCKACSFVNENVLAVGCGVCGTVRDGEEGFEMEIESCGKEGGGKKEGKKEGGKEEGGGKKGGWRRKVGGFLKKVFKK